MNIAYGYSKKRKNYGRQIQFCSTHEILLDSINPDRADQRLYCLRNPVNRECQVCLPKSEHDANTKKVVLYPRGTNHAEGGWPKDVNYNNEDETIRYRRRIEREDSYVHAIMTLTPKFEHVINQNNAIEIYQQYFKGMPETVSVEKPIIKIENLYRDPDTRPVSSICWTHEKNPKVAVTYCDKRYPVTGPVNNNLTCFLWELSNPLNPVSEFLPPTACWNIVGSPTDPGIFAGGLDDGRVCIFDIRAAKEPKAFSPAHLAHRAPVSALLFIHSRINNEFFSGSSDGQCIWYDVRNLSQPLESMVMSVKVPYGEKATCSNAEGVSALQFDRAFPTRFLCGTDTGLVINVNRKGKTHQETMSAIFKAQRGPVRAVHRSPCTSKMFLSCGDWTTHIWSDDLKCSPIITSMPHRYQIMDAAWAPQRYSSYMTVGVDGKFSYWDLLRKYREPIINMVLSRYPLHKIVPHENGRLVAMGDKSGTVFMISLSNNLVSSGDKDKQAMMQIYERETRREQILENRVKEILFKLKAEEVAGTQTGDTLDEEALLRVIEEDYRKQVVEEFRRSGITQPPSTNRPDTMRHR